MTDQNDPKDRLPVGGPRAKRPTAVALRYQLGGETLPKIVATGRGALAEEILRLAQEAGVSVREDPDLAQLLASFDLDTEIPVEAIEAVAEILNYVYRANGKLAAYKASLTGGAAPEAPAASSDSIPSEAAGDSESNRDLAAQIDRSRQR